jgi:hypothetical protein
MVEPYDSLGVLDRSQFRVVQTVALTLTWVVLLVVCLNLSPALCRFAARCAKGNYRSAKRSAQAGYGCPGMF